jgi:hypothetical protein
VHPSFFTCPKILSLSFLCSRRRLTLLGSWFWPDADKLYSGILELTNTICPNSLVAYDSFILALPSLKLFTSLPNKTIPASIVSIIE